MREPMWGKKKYDGKKKKLLYDYFDYFISIWTRGEKKYKRKEKGIYIL